MHKEHSFNEETGVCATCGYKATVLIKCSNDNNEEEFVSGDGLDETMRKADGDKFDRFYLKLYGNVEKRAGAGTYGSTSKKWIFDLNGYTISNPPGVDPDSVAALFYIVGDIMFVGKGAMNADTTPPVAEISIGTNKFNSFMNTITFGLFFKKTKTVTVTATDNGSETYKVEYLLSEKPFGSADAITGDWTELTLDDGKAIFNIEPGRKAYVYVRVTDNSSNITVVNSDGVVVYTDAEAIIGVQTFIKNADFDVVYKLNLNGNFVAKVYNGTEEIGVGSDCVLLANGMLKADIEKLIADIDTLLDGDNLTDAERTALELLKETAEKLPDRISAAKMAAESDEIKAVEGVTKDNVKREDKEPLEKAEKALEDALRDFDGNYTEGEHGNLETKLETVKEVK